MSKSNKNINLKKALDEQVPAWDDSNLWDNIEATLPAKKRKRRFLYWLLPLLGIGVVVGYMFLGHSTATLELNSQGQEKDVTTVATSVNDVSAITKESSTNKEIDLEDVNLANTTKQSQDQSNQPQSELYDHSQVNVKQQTIDNDESSGFSGSLSDWNSSTKNTFAQSTSNNVSTTESKNPVTRLSIREDLGQKSQLLGFSLLPSLTDQYPNSKYPTHIDDSRLKVNPSILEEDNHLKLVNSITVEGGLLLTGRSLESENRDWLDAKQDQEKLLETVNLEVQYQRRIGKFLQVGTGIGYTQVNELLSWADTVLTTIDTSYTSSIRNVEKTYQYLENTTPNAYQSISIPLSIGVVSTRNRWLYEARVSGNLVIWNDFRGRYIDENLALLTDHNQASLPIKTGVRMQSISVSLIASYQLTESLYLSGGLKSIYDITNRLDTQNFDLRYHGCGLQVGLRYALDGGSTMR